MSTCNVYRYAAWDAVLWKLWEFGLNIFNPFMAEGYMQGVRKNSSQSNRFSPHLPIFQLFFFKTGLHTKTSGDTCRLPGDFGLKHLDLCVASCSYQHHCKYMWNSFLTISNISLGKDNIPTHMRASCIPTWLLSYHCPLNPSHPSVCFSSLRENVHFMHFITLP